jgi:phage-related tail protein
MTYMNAVHGVDALAGGFFSGLEAVRSNMERRAAQDLSRAHDDEMGRMFDVVIGQRDALSRENAELRSNMESMRRFSAGVRQSANKDRIAMLQQIAALETQVRRLTAAAQTVR